MRVAINLLLTTTQRRWSPIKILLLLPLRVGRAPPNLYELLFLYEAIMIITEMRVPVKKEDFPNSTRRIANFLCALSFQSFTSPKAAAILLSDVSRRLHPAKASGGLSVNNIIRLHLHTRNSARFLLRQVANRETLWLRDVSV